MLFILFFDFVDLKSEFKKFELVGVDLVYIDVMDGNFVDSIIIGVLVVRSLRKNFDFFFDVYLMVLYFEKYIEKFV